LVRTSKLEATSERGIAGIQWLGLAPGHVVAQYARASKPTETKRIRVRLVDEQERFRFILAGVVGPA